MENSLKNDDVYEIVINGDVFPSYVLYRKKITLALSLKNRETGDFVVLNDSKLEIDAFTLDETREFPQNLDYKHEVIITSSGPLTFAQASDQSVELYIDHSERVSTPETLPKTVFRLSLSADNQVICSVFSLPFVVTKNYVEIVTDLPKVYEAPCLKRPRGSDEVAR